MRKKSVITMIIIFALALTGCGRARNAGKQNEINTPQQAVTHTEQNNNPSTANGDSASSQAAGGSAIVAKSSNIVSSTDKKPKAI